MSVLIVVPACALPLAAIPAQELLNRPQALAVPMEDGSVYVLAEGGGSTGKAKLHSMWRKEATQACRGDYWVLSERDAQRKRGGVSSGSIYEGYVRCVSAEGLGIDPDRVK